jgi:drug/metabolite transporter (DMT)-like permease
MTAPDAVLATGLAAVAALALAVQAVCIRIGTEDGDTAAALAVVLVVNLVAYVPVAVLAYGASAAPEPRALAAFAVAGLVGAVVGRAAYYAAIGSVGASRTEPIKASQPVHASIVAVLLLGETMTAGNVVGLALVVLGVAAITRETAEQASPDGRPAVGLALAFGAAAAFGLEPAIAKVGLQTGAPVLVGLAVKMVVAATVVLAFLASRGSLLAGFRSQQRRWYLAAGVANTAFQIAYYAAISTGKVVVVVPIVQMSPLFVAALAVVALPRLERVTWRLVAASVVVVAGAVCVTLFG